MTDTNTAPPNKRATAFVLADELPDAATVNDAARLYVLYLRPICGKARKTRMIGYAPTVAAIQAFIDEQRVPVYVTEDINEFSGELRTYRHSFRRDGPLMWFNPEGDVYEATIVRQWTSSTAILL